MKPDTAFCHEKNYVHRDLKPENIVFDTPEADHNLVVIDFGEALHVDENAMYDEFVGSIWYFPPEIIRVRKGWELKKSDMWTIGVITYILVVGRPPFFGVNQNATLQKIIEGNLTFPDEIPLSNECKNFIQCLIKWKTDERYSAKQALNHPWLNSDVEHNLGDARSKNLQHFRHAAKLKQILITNVAEHLSAEKKTKIHS